MRWHMARRRGIGAVLMVGAMLWAAPLSAQEAVDGAALTLEEALTQALRRNAELRDARLGLDGAEAQVKEAWSSVYPSVDLTASYARNVKLPVSFLPASIFDPEAPEGELVGVTFGTENNWSSQLRVEQSLFDPAAFVGVGSAGRFRNLQEETVRGTSQAIATRVRVSYFDVLLAQESVRLNENSVERVRETLEDTRAMERAGVAPSSDVLRLEVELANLEPELRRAENGLAASRRQLGIEIDWDGDPSELHVAGSLAQIALNEAAPGAPSDSDGDANANANANLLRFGGIAGAETMSDEEVQELALRNQSELRQLQLTEQLRRAELKIERAAYLPTISVFGTYSIDAQHDGNPAFFGETAQQRFRTGQVGLQVSLPIFGGLQRPALIQQRRVGVQQAETQYQLARDQTEHDIQTLLADLREARERAESQQRNIDRARRSYEMVSVEYREGIGSRIEVMDAEVALRETEFNYAQAVYDYLVARAHLDEAAGSVPLVDTDA